ncbi:hypothetical protein CASFOL_016889 [Castilleja foliolosa]|uniref:Uncharacterized protein n=1 Tax=Castilleja foliolosa TaxID=1961234 RepID=A0ABD3DAF0_9LAMI
MAPSQMNFRSISLPSRLHPINSTGFESELQNLNSCISINTPITSKAIQSSLLGLAQLYTSVDKHTQNHHQDGRSIEDSLESSIEFLDSCNNISELVQMIRENVQALQSALRRKGPASQNDVNSYFSFRKKMNKCIAKSLKTLKNFESKNGSDVDQVTIAVFKSILVFLSWPAGRSGGWNLVSRLMNAKSTENGVISEVGCADSVLGALRNCSSNEGVDLQMVLRSLQNLDDCVEGIELGLQRLFRQLLQCRVTFLNILTDH